MDKTLMLNSIKAYYKFKSDSEFARYLNVSAQVLSNWKARNTFDPEIIYTRCLHINPEWLITGKGEMLKKEGIENETVTMVSDIREEYIKNYSIIEVLKSEIYYKNQIIAGLERENKLLWKLVDKVKSDNEDLGKDGNYDNEGKKHIG